MPRLQIVLDTNVLVAALRSPRGASFRVVSLVGQSSFEINLSVPLVVEYEAVLQRQAQTLGLSSSDVNDFLDYHCTVGNLHEIYYMWRPTLRDAKDEMVLELAVKAGCPYIVTYNQRDFRGGERFGVAAITARKFLEQIGE